MKLPQPSRAVIALGMLALCLAAPMLWTLLQDGAYVGNGTDLFSYQLPMRRGAAALIAQGHWPVWNPYALAGVPTHIGMQLALTYPPNLLILLLPTAAAVELLLALHILWLAIGAMLLARAHRASEVNLLPCVVVAVIVAGGGPLWGHLFAGHVNWTFALAWLPWLWTFALRALATRTWPPLAGGAAATGMALLAGHPQVVYLGMVGLAVLLLAHALDPQTEKVPQPGRWQQAPASLAALGVLAVLSLAGLALAAVQWWPTALMAPELNRGLDTPLQIATAFSAPARSLWTVLAPSVWGGAGARLVDFPYHETVAFCGAAGAVLALLGVCLGGLRAWILAAGALLCVLLSLGSDGPLLSALVGLVPGMGSFRVPGRWLLPAVLLVALLAADGVALLGGVAQPAKKAIRETLSKRGRLAALAVLSLLGLWTLTQALGCRADGGWWGDIVHDRGPDLTRIAETVSREFSFAAVACAVGIAALLRPALRQALAVLLVVGLCGQVLVFAAGHTGAARMKSQDKLQWSAEETTALRKEVGDRHRLATAAPLRHADWGMAAGVRVAGAYEPVLTTDANRYGNALAGLPKSGYSVNFQVRRPTAWLDRIATSHLLLDGGDAQTARAFATWPEVARFDSGRVLRKNPKPMDRLAFAGHTQVVASAAAAIDLLPTLQADTVALDAELPNPETSDGTLEVLADAPARLAVRARVDKPAVLIIRDAWAPGWSAQVDGTPARTARADGLFRAVALPAGTHEIVWSYTVPGLALGGLVSVAAWCACLAALAWGWRRQRALL